MNKHEEQIDITIALLKQDLGYIKKSLRSIDDHLEKQNGKIATHGRRLSYIVGVGSAAVIIVPFLYQILSK